MLPRISFVPAATSTVSVPGGAPAVAALPTVDSGNTDLTISHNGGFPVQLSFGAGATVVADNRAGQIMVPPGTTVLLTGNAAVLAASQSELVQGGAPATVAGSSAAVSVWAAGSCQITFTRGTASAAQAFL